MILHGHPLSGNTHKVRLLLAALALKHEERVVDVTIGAHKKPDFLALNPRGQIPVLDDGEARLHDAQAILVYLARKYDRASTWLPNDPHEQGRVTEWLSLAANEIHNGLHVARMHFLLGVPIALDQATAIAQSSLTLLDAHLADRPFLELGRPTLADLACFPCVGLAPGAKISLEGYANVRRWITRIQALPFYVAMPGLEVTR